jgi:hypothetical protein
LANGAKTYSLTFPVFCSIISQYYNIVLFAKRSKSMRYITRGKLGIISVLVLIIALGYTACGKKSSSSSSAGSSAPAAAQGPAWGTPALLETDDIGDVVGTPQIAVYGSGNAIAIWAQNDAVTCSHIYAITYTVGSGWGNRALIESENAYSATNVSLAVNNSGCAIAVWLQTSGTRWNVWANRAVTGTNWGTAEPIESSADPIYPAPQNVPRIAINNSVMPLLYGFKIMEPQTASTRTFISPARAGQVSDWLKTTRKMLSLLKLLWII